MADAKEEVLRALGANPAAPAPDEYRRSTFTNTNSAWGFCSAISRAVLIACFEGADPS